ncbi:unnamed protein product [Lactuca saligna]|uniref:Uncharacterized protein n=1 Tax=Lactuca saligna TaxID=75948 RepID=A0AA36DZW3_LACSI|nr:unnamed protein product [Lactuca saligna]
MESDSTSDHDEDSKQRGPTTKAEANKVKLVVTYNKTCVPVGKEAIKLSTFEGLVARTIVPITYESWLEVRDDVREGLWQYVLDELQKSGSFAEVTCGTHDVVIEALGKVVAKPVKKHATPVKEGATPLKEEV